LFLIPYNIFILVFTALKDKLLLAVLRSHQFYAALATGKNVNDAPGDSAPNQITAKQNFQNEQKENSGEALFFTLFCST
jgi:hypothetical protein